VSRRRWPRRKIKAAVCNSNKYLSILKISLKLKGKRSMAVLPMLVRVIVRLWVLGRERNKKRQKEKRAAD